MSVLTLNSISNDIFAVRPNSGDGLEKQRADVIAAGRVLFYEHSRKGQEMLYKAQSKASPVAESKLGHGEYTELNRKFGGNRFLYAAKVACSATGEKAPADAQEFEQQAMRFFGNELFLRTLAGIDSEILNPILPATFSDAVGDFAEMYDVGFAKTKEISITSNDIPIFQDTAWGASRSVPANRFYTKDITINTAPRTAEMRFKWHQLIGNGMDWGVYYANMVAGMVYKTLAMWNEMMTKAAANPALIPTGLTGTFSSMNFVTMQNKLAAVNNVGIRNIMTFGALPAVSKILPTQSTGATNVNMDAALMTMLGDDYIRSGYLGEFMGSPIRALMDAVVPGTQNTTISTVLPLNRLWMMAANRRKPVAIAYTSGTPIQIDIRPELTASFEIIVNLTIAMGAAAIFSSKVATLTI